MQVVIFHDYDGAISGGEKTALTLARALSLGVVAVNHKRNAACDFINNGDGFIYEWRRLPRRY